MKNWIRYKICDKSGSGWDRWRYLYITCLDEYCDESVREIIVEQCETWAIHAERYQLEFERDATASKDGIVAEINKCEQSIEMYNEILITLREQIVDAD